MKFNFTFLLFYVIMCANGYDLSSREVKDFPFAEIGIVETNEDTGLKEIIYKEIPQIADNKVEDTLSNHTAIIVFLITFIGVTVLVYKLFANTKQSKCWDVTKKCCSSKLEAREEETVRFLSKSRSEECLLTMDSLDDFTITY
ncbi:Protein CBG27675 [Caenorhabditis briggsae]|uniref:Uncharacterized protein n=2 Tax=Caenorhabditis briggsae TaxID=6238 RepID=A0AAE9CUG3_CAEBR|nr:Protein CBG27675 [Caenorhabditis briggsae]ULT82075.1 hypothetical protein L3Y34_011797 [Caenorhabditis briggsae]CAR99954.1 Protein CBG27675 [Caenorhabditis briggsae]